MERKLALQVLTDVMMMRKMMMMMILSWRGGLKVLTDVVLLGMPMLNS